MHQIAAKAYRTYLSNQYSTSSSFLTDKLLLNFLLLVLLYPSRAGRPPNVTFHLQETSFGNYVLHALKLRSVLTAQSTPMLCWQARNPTRTCRSCTGSKPSSFFSSKCATTFKVQFLSDTRIEFRIFTHSPHPLPKKARLRDCMGFWKLATSIVVWMS